MIEIGKVGSIESGENIGFQVKVIDDSESTGGFLILTGKNISDPNLEIFDSWVSNKEELANTLAVYGYVILTFINI